MRSWPTWIKNVLRRRCVSSSVLIESFRYKASFFDGVFIFLSTLSGGARFTWPYFEDLLREEVRLYRMSRMSVCGSDKDSTCCAVMCSENSVGYPSRLEGPCIYHTSLLWFLFICPAKSWEKDMSLWHCFCDKRLACRPRTCAVSFMRAACVSQNVRCLLR